MLLTALKRGPISFIVSESTGKSAVRLAARCERKSEERALATAGLYGLYRVALKKQRSLWRSGKRGVIWLLRFRSSAKRPVKVSTLGLAVTGLLASLT